jgi:hypothetical protein
MIFANDEDLMYRDSEIEYRHERGRDLILSEAYRMAQLPLVAPSHPDVIRSDAAAGYDAMGTYRTARISLVGFVELRALQASAAFRELMGRLQAAAAAAKVAWALIETRRDWLHFTVAGGLSSRMSADEVVPFVQRRLAGTRRLRAQLRGLWFARDRNGRGYFPVYPELGEAGRGGGPPLRDRLAEIQHALDARVTRGYLVGFLQLCDHLRWPPAAARHQADEWFEIVEAFRDRVICEVSVTELCVIATHDDLTLSGRVLARIPLRV